MKSLMKFSRGVIFSCLVTTASALALSGCMRVQGSALPGLTPYSTTFQTQLAKEQPLVRECCPATSRFVKDSVRLRQKVRAGRAIDLRR